MVISLIGYRGSGKTSVAAPLAARLGWDWTDADTLIEEHAGRTIREIFSEQGEPCFREWERQVMAELLGREQHVVSAGGGAVLDAGTRGLLRASGPVIWLRASLATLTRRIEEDLTTRERRPALTTRGATGEIAELLARREPLYRECASLIVETAELPITQIVDQILAALDLPD